MRCTALALVLLFPLAADAQNGSNARSRRAEALSRSPEVVRPPAGERRPETRAEQDARRDWQRWPQLHRPRWKQPHVGPRYPFGSYYAMPYGGGGSYFFGPAAPVAEERIRESEPPRVRTVKTTGLVRVEVTPATVLDYYIDGLFVGSAATLGPQFEVNAGSRRIEIRSAGYKPLVRDLRINEGDEIVVRGTLEPLVQPQPPPATGSRTIYIIPGCYVGNSRPSADGLRTGCDIRNLITR